MPGTTLTATSEQRQVHGSAGCKSCSRSYQIAADTIAVGELNIIEMACLEPRGIMEQETLFVELLRG
jgi:heat shock protein HslJ